MAVSGFRFGRVLRVLGSDRGAGRWRTVVVVAAAAAVLFGSTAPAPAVDQSTVVSLGVPEPVAVEPGEVPVLVDSAETAIPKATSGGGAVAATDVAGIRGVSEVAVQSSGGWWNGTAVLATNAPALVEQGLCSSFGDGGSVALLAGAKLSKVCGDDGLSGSVRGVAWFEGFDSDGSFVGVELVGVAGLAESVYRGLGSVDVVFDGGTFTADFTECEHQTESTFSSCLAVIAGVSLPPGPLVGVATAGTVPPSRSVRSTEDTRVTPAAERAALVALYDATDGANWTRNTNWNTSAAVGTWYGVTTNDTGSVTHVYMFRNGLVGPLPSQIRDLANLTDLYLSGNGLSGTIPVELGDLANLTRLSLEGNGLSETIPTELGDLTNLTRLSLNVNDLSGTIPTELGNLTNLTSLNLHGNDLSGTIPTELGNLINLTSLSLSNNKLSGTIPAVLGGLTNLTFLDLSVNGLRGSIPVELGGLINLTVLNLGRIDLSGCVPFALSTVRYIYFDSTLEYCGVAAVAPTHSRARETDGAAVFTLSVVPPSGTGAGDATAVTVDFTVVEGSAVAGTDFTATSGTVRVPAGSRYVTVSVPLVDDSTVESDESFTLRLSNPVGAVLTGTSAAATIVDDDLGLSDRFVPVGVCPDAVVEGFVGDVFDVAQSGFSGFHHVFVDVDLDCGARLTSGAGYPIAVSVIHGPAASVGLSGHCVIQTGSVKATASRATSGGCRTFAAPVPSQLSLSGRSTHVLRIPDSAVGLDHQVRVWVDYDGDGVHDGGEPYEIFESNFVSRRQTDSDTTVFEYPRDFEIELVDGSARLARGGRDIELTLRLVAPERQSTAPHFGVPGSTTTYMRVANTPIGVLLGTGPSQGQRVVCVDTPNSAPRPPTDRDACFSDDHGRVVLRYRVPADAVELFSMQQDLLFVYLDENRNGLFDIGPFFAPLEPVANYRVPIAKAVNYVALGDSYSSGENGETPTSGVYQTGVSDADGQCRRWDQAYPYVFAREVLNIDAPRMNIRFTTFACTGAKTHNIYDPTDPNPTPPPPEIAHFTDRPSSAAVLGQPETNQESPYGPIVQVRPRDQRWEPRQAVSLQDAQTELERTMRNVGMITVTIGGNDAGFAEVLKKCVKPSGCNEHNSETDFAQIGDQVAAVITRLRATAPEASIFVLGYPYLTPNTGACAAPQVTYVPGSFTGDDRTIVVHESDECEARFNRTEDCSALSAGGIVNRSYAFVGAVFQFFTDYVGSISFAEAIFLQNQADELNAQISNAARRSGAHFVDVVGAGGFVGHSPCAGSAAWLNGFAAKSGRLLLRGQSIFDAVSDRSFHPNTAGHGGYSDLLEAYIRVAAASVGTELNEAGLPVNPVPQGGSSGVRSALGSAPVKESSAVTGQTSDTAQGADTGDQTRNAPEPTTGYLLPQRIVAVTGCGAPFASPGEQVRLVAGGFAANATVTFTAQAMSLGGTELTAPTIPAATADADGVVDVLWTIPTAPAATVDAAPRVFLIEASGLNPDGGAHAAVPLLPLAAYPDTASCAAADAATTTLGQAVNITVLANDTAPTGGALDATTVRMLGDSDQGFTVNSTTRVVTYTPEPGFYGTASGAYVVFDGWGVGVQASITVTVASGCTITGVVGVTEITGTAGDDVICVPDPDDRHAFHVIDGLGGNDVIIGGAGTEWIYGGAGADTVYGRGGEDRIVAGSGVDTVYGGDGVDHIYSLDLEDIIVDDDYEMLLTPQAAVTSNPPVTSDDWAWVDTSDMVNVDVLGNDHDPNENLDPSSLTITRQPTVGTATVATASDSRTVIEYTAPALGGTTTFAYQVCDTLKSCATAEVTVMVGTTGCTIVGTDAAETLRGTPGDDVICGLGGGDVIYGHGGDDTIIGGEGDDTLYGGNSTLIGVTDGDDLLWGGAGDDSLFGGNGNDTLWGGAGADTLAGNRRDDLLYGGDGDDNIVGGGENDVIFGGAGDDSINGHAHDDTIYGGPGDDMVRGGNGDDTLWGNAGDDTLAGNAGADVIYGGPGVDTLDGHTQNDMLWGGTGDDTLNGRRHDDQLHGGPGDDTLNGGSANDRVYGGTGTDTLDGGDGTDHIDGGPDTDTCSRGDTATSCESEARL